MPPSAIDLPPSETLRSPTITDETLTRLVEDLFTTMLDLTIVAAAPEEITEDAFLAAIRIDGAWNATLHLYAPPKLARRIARAMFDQGPSDLDLEDVLDAFGEVVNVIGGNMKGVVDRDCNLSLPCVGFAGPNPPRGGREIAYQVNGDPLTIVLVED